MKNTFIILVLFCIVTITKAQENFSMDPWKVTQYEMDMTEYANDTEAEAVVIFDKGKYRFTYNDNIGFVLSMTKHIKIKILSQAGEKYASFEIPYYMDHHQNSEEIELVEGKTYNLQDQKLEITALENKNIYEEKINANWRVKKLTMPNVRVGSVIEFEYTINTPHYINMRTWEFQKKIPTVYSVLEYKAIPYYEYAFLGKRISKLDVQESTILSDVIRHRNLEYKEIQYKFGLKDIPAFKDEDFITSENDYIQALHFQLSRIHSPNGSKRNIISTWPALCDELLKDADFGKTINNYRKEAKKILPKLGLEEKTEIEKVKTIAEYVKKNYNWNGFTSKYSSQKTSELLKTQKGNVADLNLFLIGLLQEAGLTTNPILLSTRTNGSIDKAYPFMHFFNYVIAEVIVAERKIHIDATDPMLAYNSVPTKCTNIEGLVIKPKSEEWTFIRQKEIDYSQKQFKLNIDPANNEIGVKAEYASIGNSGYKYRVAYLGKNENLIKHLKDDENIDVIDSVSIKMNQSLEKPFSFSFEFKSSYEKASNKIFIAPFCKLEPKENPFKQSKRDLPVDMIYAINRKYSSKINIPEGYEIESIPENFHANGATINMNYLVEKDEESIAISVDYKFNKNIYDASSYEDLKNEYSKMLSKFSEMVVLKKIEN